VAISVKKILNVLGTVAVVAVIVLFAYLKWWNLFGRDDLGGSCRTRAGCKSMWCLSHELTGSGERESGGYCTDKCDKDSDCNKDMKCVAPSAQAADDLARLGRPSKLCERVRAGGS
jgi:hypothetical protein